MDPSAAYLHHGTSLSAEVEPFIPRSDIGNMMMEHMNPQASHGPLPHYLTSCYPFVQDHAGNTVPSDQFDNQNYYKNARAYPQGQTGQNHPYQQHLGHQNRFVEASAQPPAPNMPHPTAHSTPVYTYHPNSTQFQYPDYSPVPYHHQYVPPPSQHHSSSKPMHSKRDNSGRRSNERKQHTNKKGQRSIGIQMEIPKTQKDKEDTDQKMVDCALQTDFPLEIASKTLAEKPSPLKKMTRSSRRRRSNTSANRTASCESSDNNGDEADVDSDSGYYSPKHQISKQNRSFASSAGNGTQDDMVAAQPNYSVTDPALQRLLYMSGPPAGHPAAYYQVHPNSYLSASATPGQVVRLPTPGTPPMIMTPPPVLNLGATPMGHHVALANFKSRSSWEQEVLKAHNVAPICPPAFAPRNRAPSNQGGGRGNAYQPKNWNYPRYQGPRHPAKGSPQVHQSGGMHNQTSNMGSPSYHKSGHGMLRVNPNTAPPHLVHQNPPQLTDEDFPDLQATSGGYESARNSMSNFSYSAALQSVPRSNASDISVPDDSPIKSLIEADESGTGKGSRRRRKKTERAAKAAAEEYAEITKEQENLKKQLKKKSTAKTKSSQLDLAEMLSKLEKTQSEDNDTSNINDHSHSKSMSSAQRTSQLFTPHNPLDSSAPLRKRGKEREVPKIKKHSALKKVILKEREEKKAARISSLETDDAPEYDIPPVSTDFFRKEFMQNEESLEKTTSDDVPTSEAETPENSSPITVSASGNSSPIVPGNLPKIHSRRYREYCSGQVLDKEIDEECIVILQKLVQFQERLYQKDPIKAKSRRRFVLGIREVTKHLKLNKLCCVLISPNLERIQSKGGLDEALQQIIQLCKSQSVPYVFALGRCAMGRAVSKLVPVSIIGIFDYSGAEESFKRMLNLVQDAQKKYHEMMVLYQQEIAEAMSTPPTAPPAPTKRFAHMGHSRNPSAASCVSFCSMISEPISEMNPSEGTSWRNIMDVTDEQNPTPALSPPPETAQEEELENEASADKDVKTNDGNEKELREDHPSELQEMLNNSIGSIGSDGKQSKNELRLENSYSTVSTIVPMKDSTAIEKPSSKSIDLIQEKTLPSTSDTDARIESWLASAVQTMGMEDAPDEKLEKIDESNPGNDELEDDDEFVSTHEDDIDDSHEEE